MYNKLISVVVPAHNCERYIEKCLDSILDSDYPNMEIIIIDDGSSDHTGVICKKYAEKYVNVSYIYQSNSGVSVARNRGIIDSKGEYVAFVDGDDMIDSHMISHLVSNLDNSTDIVICSYGVIEENENVEHKENDSFEAQYFYSNPFCAETNSEKEKLLLQLFDSKYGKPAPTATAVGVPWGKLYRREFLISNELFFNIKLRRKQDNVMNMFAFSNAKKIIYTNEPFYFYRLEHIHGFDAHKKFIKPENIIEIVRCRDKFMNAYPEMITPEMKKRLLIEAIGYLGVIARSCIYDNESTLKQYDSMKSFYKRNNLRKYIGNLKSDIPFKPNFIRFLYVSKLYFLLFVAFKCVK